MKKWESYEEVSRYLIDRVKESFDLIAVEGKQSIKGQRAKNSIEIDGKGVLCGNEGFLIIECKRHTSQNLSQDIVGSIAYRILNSGAKGGILVSPLSLQKSAILVAEAENIVHLQLGDSSTRENYIMRFLNQINIGTFSDSITTKVAVTGIRLTKVVKD